MKEINIDVDDGSNRCREMVVRTERTLYRQAIRENLIFVATRDSSTTQDSLDKVSMNARRSPRNERTTYRSLRHSTTTIVDV
jgi:hypothetical protein